MPPSPPSRPPHAPSSPPAHDSWMRNYESVDYELPLLHPQGQLDSGDEDEEVKKGEQKSMPSSSQTDQPPRTPPKNPSLSPKSLRDDGNASAGPRLPDPARSPSHTRNGSSQSATTSPTLKSSPQRHFSPPLSFDKNQGAVTEGQMATGPSGSPNTGHVTDISHQSSLSTTTAPLPTTPSRSPRSSSFRSSPLAASVSSLSPGLKSPPSYAAQAPPPTSGSNSSSILSPSDVPNSSTITAPAMNTSPSMMSSPHSVGHSSSSSTPPSSFFQSGQGSSSGQNIPSMPNTPYSQYPHPNANSPPFAKPGTRPNMNVNPGPTNNNNNAGHMNPAYPQQHQQQRIIGTNDETRALVGPHGVEGGSGRASPHSQSGFGGVTMGLRDPSSMNNNNHPHPHHHHPTHHPQAQAQAQAQQQPQLPHLTSSGSRASMILYRLSATEDGMLPPPGVPAGRRTSVYSNSGDSIVSLSGDSKYPLVGFGTGTRTPGTPGRPGTPGTPTHNGSIGNRGGELSMSEIGRVHGGLVAYMYDPGQDLDADELDEEEEEWVKMVGGHVPRARGDLKGFGSFGNANVRMNVNNNGPGSLKKKKNGVQNQNQQAAIRTSKHTPPPTGGVPWRGLINVTTLILLILGLLCLFLLYPVWRAYNNNGVEQLILGNTRINSTGQAVNEVVVNRREWSLPGFNREFQ